MRRVAQPDPAKYRLSFEQLTHMLTIGVGVLEKQAIGASGNEEEFEPERPAGVYLHQLR